MLDVITMILMKILNSSTKLAHDSMSHMHVNIFLMFIKWLDNVSLLHVCLPDSKTFPFPRDK